MDNIIQNLSQIISTNSLFIPIMFVASFCAGIIASLSPCSLGILPLIIGYVGGYSKEGNKKLFLQMISFSFGLSIILSIIGVLCALTGRAFASFASPIFLLLFASILVILGLNLVGIIDINFPSFVKKMPQNKTGSIFVVPFIVGCLFALAASPCSSPLLATIMAVSTVSNSVLFSILLLFFFAMGQCVIIILIALFASILKHTSTFAKYSHILMKISGIIIFIAGCFVYYLVFSNI